MTTAGPAVSARGLSKVFSNGTVAFQNVDLEIPEGSFFLLIGPSGCGKSTFLSLVGDLGGSFDGQLSVYGKSPSQVRQERGYGIVFQSATLLAWRSAQQNVSLPLEVMKTPRQERERLVTEALELVGLSDFRGHYPWQLSGGMQQRVAITRALVYQPRLLLMDEPFGALDEITRERLNFEILRIWQEVQNTVIFITHSVPEAVFLSTHIAVMEGQPGRIKEVIENDLGYPRDASMREDDRYFQLLRRVRVSLGSGEGGSITE